MGVVMMVGGFASVNLGQLGTFLLDDQTGLDQLFEVGRASPRLVV